LIGCAPVKVRVRSSAIVEVKIPADRSSGFGHAVISPEIHHLLAFDAAPQPLDNDVAAPSALAVFADCNAVLDQPAGERSTGELRALVCVDDLRLAVLRQASSNVSTQNAASIVIDRRHDRTRRLNITISAAIPGFLLEQSPVSTNVSTSSDS
jgi:hypothetical protein